MKYLCTLLSSVLLLAMIPVTHAKTPAITTPKMTDQEYALALELDLELAENNASPQTKFEEATTAEALELVAADDKRLKYRCDISLSQPFALENPEKIVLARGVGEKSEEIVIKIKHTPIKLSRTHYETEHLHIWSNSEKDLLITFDVREAYRDQYVSLQSGTLTILAPTMKEEYQAVLSCKA